MAGAIGGHRVGHGTARYEIIIHYMSQVIYRWPAAIP